METHWTYRFWDQDNALLYVGSTNNPGIRFHAHASAKEWWPQVWRIECERHPDRGMALAAERAAILRESPRHNVARYATAEGSTPLRSFRVPDDLWQQARARAAEEGVNLSEIVRQYLTEYAERDVR